MDTQILAILSYAFGAEMHVEKNEGLNCSFGNALFCNANYAVDVCANASVIKNEKEENIQLKKEIDCKVLKAKRRWNLFIVKTFSAVLERKLQLNRFLPLLKGKRVKEEKQNRSNEIFPFLFEQS